LAIGFAGGQKVWSIYLQGRKVNYTVNVWVFLEDFLQGWLVGDVDLIEDGSLSTQQLNAVQTDFG
jgi:hypothetical protein